MLYLLRVLYLYYNKKMTNMEILGFDFDNWEEKYNKISMHLLKQNISTTASFIIFSSIRNDMSFQAKSIKFWNMHVVGVNQF